MIATVKNSFNEITPLMETACVMSAICLFPFYQKKASLTNLMGAATMVLGSLNLILKASALPTFREKKIYHPQNLMIATAVTTFLASCNYAYFACSGR